MAIAAGCVWEVRSTGSDSNGGGYVSGAGTDYSQQDAAQLTVTDAAATGTTNLSSATGGFTSSMVNNIVNVVGQGRRQIMAYVDTNNVTCDAAWGTFSGATANVGGGLATPGMAFGSAVANNTIRQRPGTYLVSGTANTSGGPITFAVAGLTWIGIDADGNGLEIGDLDMPIIRAGANSVTCVTVTNNWTRITGIEVDGNRGTYTGTAVFTGNGSGPVINCRSRGSSSGNGFPTFATSAFCYSTDHVGNGFGNAGQAVFCVSHANTIGFNGQSILVGCLGYDNQIGAAAITTAINCTFADNTSDGLDTTSGGFTATNCIFDGNGGYGLDNNSAIRVTAINCAFRGNTSGAIRNAGNAIEVGSITLSSDPFSDRAGDDYSLGSSAGAIQCTGTGESLVGSPDIGAVQKLSVGGGVAQGLHSISSGIIA